jgi:ActR/RegA family two-component response regulator
VKNAVLDGAMKEVIRLDGLLLSNDAQVVQVMSQILASFSIQTEVCSEVEPALAAVTHRRLDAVIVDWNSSNDPTLVVRSARKSSPNSNSTIVAMVDAGSETHALLVGANFMIYKPVDLDHASRCMRAAYGTMLQERRRAARVSVDIPVMARVSGLGVLSAQISDLSRGGLALQCNRALEIESEVSLWFPLPGNETVVSITGKVVNRDATGRAGIRFSLVPELDLNFLETWLAEELAKLEHVEIPVGDTICSIADKQSDGLADQPSNALVEPTWCAKPGEN